MWKRFLKFWARHEKKVNLILLAAAVLFPLVITRRYIISVGIMCGIYIILSLSMNLITGYMGIVVLGQAAFFGVGAYTAAIMATRFQTDFILNCILAALICAVFGLMIGSPTLRLQGSYLSIVTLGFGEIMCIIELNWIELTRGPYGINNIPMPRILGFEINNARGFYYLVLALCLLTILVVHNITDSRTGRAFSAIKGDEIAAQSMGVNMFSYKLQCFAVSAAIAGVAGAFYAQYMSFVDSTTFTSDQSFQILGMTILGGLGNIWGSILGAISMTILPEALRSVADYRQIIYGLLLAVMVIIKPDGILGGFNLKHIRQQNGYGEE